MKTVTMKASISLALVGLFVSSVALAGITPREPSSESIEACVAEIRENADYTDAGRVRHDVERFGHRSLAHKLRISTAVYDETGENVIRAYSTRCIVYGDDEPVFFSIEATNDSA